MKKKKQKTHVPNQLSNFVTSHKLIVFLLLIVLLFPANFAFNKYKDWDNAQLIKGLARDFPALTAEIEQATGLDLEEKNDCMTTTEKFSSGVRTCELAFGLQAPLDDVTKAASVIESSRNFDKLSTTLTERGGRYNYRNKESCTFSSISPIYGSCVFAVREANVKLAQEVFSGL